MEFAEIIHTEPITGMDAGPLWQRLRDHEHHPVTGVCERCGRAGCRGYTKARGELVDLGLLDEQQ